MVPDLKSKEFKFLKQKIFNVHIVYISENEIYGLLKEVYINKVKKILTFFVYFSTIFYSFPCQWIIGLSYL